MLSSLIDVATVKPAVEVADIFRLYFDDYLKAYHCTPEEFAAVNAIIACRTAAAGGFIRQCDQCGKFQISYCSCGNRNCPKCGAFAKAQWLAQQEARLLPVPHFQVVFTLDHLLNDLAYVNPKAIYDLLFTKANGVLKEFAQRYLDGKVGVTAVLHTWGQTVQHHIHLHCMVTGGALVSTADGYRWQVVSPGFLFPAVELSAAFRDAFCQGLRRLARRGELRLVGSCADLDLEMLIQTVERKAWELFVGKPPKDVRLLLGTQVDFTPSAPPKLEMGAWLATLGLADVLLCPFCGKGTLHMVADFATLRLWHLWLLLWLGVPIFGKEAL